MRSEKGGAKHKVPPSPLPPTKKKDGGEREMSADTGREFFALGVNTLASRTYVTDKGVEGGLMGPKGGSDGVQRGGVWWGPKRRGLMGSKGGV